MLRRLCFAVVLATAFAAVPATAAPGGPNQPIRDEVKEKVRAMRIARVIEVLDLDEQGAMRLAPVLNRAYDEMAEVTKDSGEARRELRVLVLAPRPDEARVNALIDRLLANKVRVEGIENRMFGEVRKLLPPAQVGRLVVALPEINHQIQEQIRTAVQRGPGLREKLP
jgi:Spy/CpxP family protein refolding chaperone